MIFSAFEIVSICFDDLVLFLFLILDSSGWFLNVFDLAKHQGWSHAGVTA